MSQIKFAIAQLARGNDLVFATGKAARAREREKVAQAKAGVTTEPAEEGSVTLNHKFMNLNMQPEEEGCADDAWDD